MARYQNSERMKVTRDIDSDKLLMSKEINHGDWPFRFVIRIQYTENWGKEAAHGLGKYCVGLLVVSPTAAKETDAYESAMRSCGYTEEQLKKWGSVAEYEMLIDYGTFARLGEWCGNNLKTLLQQTRKELRESDFLFGFKMDRTQNAIGDTGWDWIRGDIGHRLRETEDSAQ